MAWGPGPSRVVGLWVISIEELVKLPIEEIMNALVVLYFALLAITLWRAEVVGVDKIRGGYRYDLTSSKGEIARGYIRMIFFASTKDKLLRVLFWAIRLVVLVFVIGMAVMMMLIASPWRMSIH